MPSTSRGYPYPTLSDPPNTSLHLQQLARAVDTDVAALRQRFDSLRPKIYSALATGSLDGSATRAAIPGATITVTTQTAATWLVEAIFDVQHGVASTATVLGYCHLDGEPLIGQALSSATAATDRITAHQQWDGVFSGPGTHTFQLAGTLANGQRIREQNTRLRVTIYEAA